MENEPTPTNQTSNNPRTPEKPTGYKKRPLWQWVALYVIIGGIVYALIYMLIIGTDGY